MYKFYIFENFKGQIFFLGGGGGARGGVWGIFEREKTEEEEEWRVVVLVKVGLPSSIQWSLIIIFHNPLLLFLLAWATHLWPYFRDLSLDFVWTLCSHVILIYSHLPLSLIYFFPTDSIYASLSLGWASGTNVNKTKPKCLSIL